MRVDTPNIILITIDCLRFDHLGCYGYKRNITPNIDALALKGVRFLQAISHGGSTATAVPSIMASILPPLQIDEVNRIMRRSTTLAELLKETGYHAAGFHSNPALAQSRYNYDKGFDTFEDNFNKWGTLGKPTIRQRLGKKIRPLVEPIFSRSMFNLLIKIYVLSGIADYYIHGPPYLRARELTNDAIEWLRAQEEKFFLWIHYMDGHFPYMPPPEYLSQLRVPPVSPRKMIGLLHKRRDKPSHLSPSEVNQLIDLYDAGIMSIDNAIGRLLDSVDSHLTNTVVVITADHGEEFGEHGGFGHHTVYDELVHVPLIMAGPKISSGTVVRPQVSHLDLAPTLADLIGIGRVPNFQGKSLLPEIMGEENTRDGVLITFADREKRKIGYRVSGWKYIRTESLGATDTILAEETYDLKNDPGETRNLHHRGSSEASDFELQAKNKILQFKKRRIEEEITYEKHRIKAKIKTLKKRKL